MTQTTTEVRCPKCGSNQLTTNRKGFSGKKAVGGAILTGGIGLLAGTIGSNKVKITCLACGKEFKPGEGRSITTPIVTQTVVAQDVTETPELSAVDQHIIELCQAGVILAAVKYYKDQSGLSLKEAKDYVYNLAAQHGIATKTGCFIATACYGNYDAPEVLVLRQFRDEKLLQNLYGKMFVKFYYSVSPFLTRTISKSDTLKKSVRKYFLEPIVEKLQR